MPRRPRPTAPRPKRRWVELSDLVVDFRADGTRHPVAVADVESALSAAGSRAGRRLLRRLPTTAHPTDHASALIDSAAIDGVLLRSHLELQRLAEEIQHGPRVARLLRPLLAMVPGPKRVVDIGCGLGYLVRYFAHTGVLGSDVEVVGVDFNRSLLGAAERLAADEGLDCRFVAGDVFALDLPATVYLSSGVIHHFEAGDLAGFFARQVDAGAGACFHFDVAPTWLTPLGAWVFHQARMREPLARHDGVRSALRAHSDDVLVSTLSEGAPGWSAMLFDSVGRRMALLNVMRPVIGMRADLESGYRAGLGPLARRLSTP